MDITYNSIGLTVSIQEQIPYTTEYRYAIEEERDSTNAVSWIEMGSEHDNIVCKFKALVQKDDLPKLEQLMRERCGDSTITISNLLNGFRPFGWNKDHSGSIGITILDITPEKQKNIFAKVQRYDFEIALINPLNNTVLPENNCRNFGFDMDGVTVPYPTGNFDYVINNRHISFLLNGKQADIRHRPLAYGDEVTITSTLTYKQTQNIIDLIEATRGGEYYITLPTNYFMFGHSYSSNIICRLASNRVSYVDKGRDNIDITFGLQIVGVE